MPDGGKSSSNLEHEIEMILLYCDLMSIIYLKEQQEFKRGAKVSSTYLQTDLSMPTPGIARARLRSCFIGYTGRVVIHTFRQPEELGDISAP